MLTKIRPPLLLLVALLALIAACDSENQPPQVIAPVAKSIQQERPSGQIQRSRLYDPNTCLKLSELLYEGYLYGYQTTPFRQSGQACEQLLTDTPDDFEARLNLIASRYLLSQYTLERLKTEKVEETVRKGVTEGIEEARLLLGKMVGNKYFNDPLNRVDILLPLLKSKDSKMLAVVGVDMQLEKSSRYDSLDLSIAYKYLPMRLFEEARSLNNIIAKNYAIAIPYRQNFNYKLAALAFERAYTINKDILSGFKLSHALMNSKGVKRDTEKALEILHSIVDRGAPKGHILLALIYSIFTSIGNEVEGFVKDEKKSIYYFEEAAKRGDNVARAALADIFLDETTEYYNKSKGIEIFCQIPDEKRQEFSVTTVLSKRKVRVDCETENRKQ